MHATKGSHWFGVFFIFLAALLLVLASITAPVVDDLSLFTVVLNKTQDNEVVLRLGTFGFCGTGTSNDKICSRVRVGYTPCHAAYNLTYANDPVAESTRCGAADNLTHAMVMHPVASAVAFIAAFISMAAGFAGSLIGAIVALLAWIFTIVAMGVDFTVFGIVKKRLDDYSQDTQVDGNFGPILWCVVAAFVFLTVGTPIVLYTSFAVRKAKKRIAAPAHAYRHSSAVSASTPDDKDIYRP